MDAPQEAIGAAGIGLAALRALCQLIAQGGIARAGSVTVDVGRDDGAGIAVLREARRVSREFAMLQRTELRHGRVTIHVWRDASESRTSTSDQYLAFQY
jgi:hypothetical protein